MWDISRRKQSRQKLSRVGLKLGRDLKSSSIQTLRRDGGRCSRILRQMLGKIEIFLDFPRCFWTTFLNFRGKTTGKSTFRLKIGESLDFLNFPWFLLMVEMIWLLDLDKMLGWRALQIPPTFVSKFEDSGLHLNAMSGFSSRSGRTIPINLAHTCFLVSSVSLVEWHICPFYFKNIYLAVLLEVKKA